VCARFLCSHGVLLCCSFLRSDNMADDVCTQLGFASGQIYTYGHTHLLPTLPIVAGFVTCAGGEANIFACPESGGNLADRDCEMGCAGFDGVPGTSDDTIDPRCTHMIDQGVICEMQDTPQALSPVVQRCAGAGAGMCASCDTSSQPIIFSCVEYYTTQCEYDVTNNELANGVGSYMTAMQAFAACADVVPEPVGYCHGSLASAAHLANHEVCMGAPADDPSTPDVDESLGSTENIAFHIRIPFIVQLAGLYTFRYHMDMGLGSFMGIDGPEFRPGLSVCPPVCVPVCVSGRQCVCPSVCLPVCSCVCPSVCLSVWLSVCPSVCPSVQLEWRRRQRLVLCGAPA
jgi:hypothetical protein